MSEIDFSAFSANLKSYCEKVADGNDAVIVTMEDKRRVMLVDFEEILALIHYFESLTFFNVIPS